MLRMAVVVLALLLNCPAASGQNLESVKRDYGLKGTVAGLG